MKCSRFRSISGEEVPGAGEANGERELLFDPERVVLLLYENYVEQSGHFECRECDQAPADEFHERDHGDRVE